mgnify:CR=1 FL=1
MSADGAQLTRIAARGMGWQGAATMLVQALQAASTLIAAALVGPAEFALWGIASVLFNAQHLVGSLGFGPALIYHRRDERFRDAVDSAFAVTLAVTLAIALAAALLAPAIARALAGGFADDDVVAVVRVMSAVFACAALAHLPQALLEKALDFRRRALAEMACAVVYLALAALLLAQGYGVWALITGRAAQTALLLTLSWTLAPVRPRLPPRVHLPTLRRLFAYGRYFGLAAVCGVVFSNADTLAVGMIAGAEALGAYALAYSVAALVPTFLALSLGKVFFPIFADVRDDDAALRAAFGDALHALALLALPATAALALVAPGALVDVFGADWQPARPLLRILSLYALFRALTLLGNLVLAATGRPAAIIVVEALSLLATGAALPFLASSGAAGVAWAFTAGQAAAAAWAFGGTRRLWSRALVRPLAPSALAALAGAAAGGLAAAVMPLADAARGWAIAAAFGLACAATLLVCDRRLRGLLRPGARGAGELAPAAARRPEASQATPSGLPRREGPQAPLTP